MTRGLRPLMLWIAREQGLVKELSDCQAGFANKEASGGKLPQDARYLGLQLHGMKNEHLLRRPLPN